MNIMVGNQIRDSDVDRRIISMKILQNQTLWIKNFTITRKILKLVSTDRKKWIKKVSHRRYTSIWHVCLPMHKLLEEIMETALN